MTDTLRLIEHAFPLVQASLESVHEKNAWFVRVQDQLINLLAKAQGNVLIGPALVMEAGGTP